MDFDPAPGGLIEEPQIADQLSTRHRYRVVVEVPPQRPSSAIEQMASATPAEAQAGMDAWMRWAEDAGERIVDLGAPLGESTVVGAPDDVDGSYIAGYSLMQAGSVDELKDVLEGHPHLQMDGASIQVLEVLAMPGT